MKYLPHQSHKIMLCVYYSITFINVPLWLHLPLHSFYCIAKHSCRCIFSGSLTWNAPFSYWILSFQIQFNYFYVRFSVICVPNTQWERHSSLSPTQFSYSSIWYVSYSAFHYLFTFLCPLLKFEFFKDNDSLLWHFIFTPITVFF